MLFYERLCYFVLFLINKYIGLQITERWLEWFENVMICKYLSKNEIDHIEIPTIQVDDFSNDEFVKLSNGYQTPVLIKGLMKNSDAVSKWDINYFNKNINDNFELNVLSRSHSKDQLVINTMKFCDFVKNKNKQLYINNNHTILSKFPNFFDDFSTEYHHILDVLQNSINLRNIHIANLFIGCNENNSEPSGTNLHCGGSGNFFCMIRGTKEWTLISPKYSCLLKGRVASSGIHAQTLFEMMDMGLDKYPQIYKHLPRYKVILEPGDVLWNAPWWWHRIRNGPGENIGMAIRHNKVTKLNLQNNLAYTLSGHVYLFYNSFLIGMYEKFLSSKQHFGASKKNNSKVEKDDVLYQINKLSQKYPKSVTLDDILQINTNINSQ